MGAKNSRDVSWRGSSFGSGSSSHGHYDYPPSSYTQQNQNYASQDQFPPQQPYYAPPPENFGSRVPDPRRKFDRRFSRIADNYNSLEQVTEALARAGLESSNLIVGIDFTKSNEWTGAKSFNRQSLHHIGSTQNPYEQAISILGRTLIAFDEDNLIPCFGFGDASTHDQDVFSFYPDERPCNGFEEALEHYREIVPHLRLAGPTSFAPIIEMAMTIVEQSGGQYHVLLIIADGQVTRSVDTNHGQLSPQEQKTVDAIVKASEYPLSIILVGVGDGPWDTMKEFDDNIPARAFDNFQFVNFTEIMLKNVPVSRKETEFALAALMEIPTQYKATIELNILGRRRGEAPDRVPLPPPLYGTASFGNQKPYHSNSFQQNAPPYYGRDTSVGTAPAPPYYGHDTTVGTTPAPPYHGHDSRPPRSSSFQQSAPPYYERDTAVGTAPAQPYYGHDTAVGTAPTPHYGHGTAVGTAPPESTTAFDDQICPICFSNPKNMAFGCGHQTCYECGQDLVSCPICRSTIQTRIKLY